MLTSTKLAGYYRGIAINCSKYYWSDEEINNEMFDFVKAMMMQEREYDKYEIAGTKIGSQSLEKVKGWIDRFLAGDEDFAQCNIETYCINKSIKCSDCSLKNYNKDCQNNKIV